MHWLQGKRRDSLRLALQASLAGALAYGVEGLWGGDEGFLAVISAALVLDVNSDQTLNQARARILATGIGSVLGISVLALFGGAAVWGSLAIVLALMAAIAAYRPSWSYGIVAACALAIGAEENTWDVALNRAIAIATGAGVGLAVSFFVWPESAQQRTRRAVQAALGECCDLLQSTVETVASKGRSDPDEHHRRFSNQISGARNAAAAISVGAEGDSENYRQLVDRVDRLWHALIILDRVGEQQTGTKLPMPEATLDAIKELQATAARSLEALSEFEVFPKPQREELSECLERTRRTVMEDFERSEGATEDRLQISALIFGLEETLGNINEISAAIASL